jgi:hypothetical protein
MQSRSRWPEWPHPKHRTSPRQSATKWSDAKHRKQRPKVLLEGARKPSSFLGGGATTFSSLGRRRPPTSSQACPTVAMESSLTIVGLKFAGSLSGGGGDKCAGAGAAGRADPHSPREPAAGTGRLVHPERAPGRQQQELRAQEKLQAQHCTLPWLAGSEQLVAPVGPAPLHRRWRDPKEVEREAVERAPTPQHHLRRRQQQPTRSRRSRPGVE